MNNEILLSMLDGVNDFMVNARRFLHTIPEISGKEFETTKYLQAEVKKCGLPIEIVTETGFIATLDTGKPGKTIALRADIDGLPLDEDENNLKCKKVVVSQNPGKCHACGHDGHMAILLGAMKVLCEIKDELIGKILFCFEDGEEIWTGIHQMMDALSKKEINAVYGTHVTSFMKTGTISVEPGPRMAGRALVEMEVCGKSGHGSRPDLSINPIFAAAQVLNGLSNAWNNQIDVTQTVTLGITQIHGGTANNIIPEKVFIGGTLRFFNMEEGQKAVDVLKHVSDYTAKAHRCNMNFIKAEVVSDPVINDEKLSAFATTSLSEVFPAEALQTGVNWFASESFSEYCKKYPSIFAFVGIKNETLGIGAEHHNIQFDFDDNALKVGATATVKFVLDFLTKNI